MKVAAILFVKNEVEDIAWWISWHLSTGIETLVIYDDYSTDGTWEVINAAAAVFDVRPRRAVQALYFNHRQAQTYMAALDELREEFDWLICLDADEYLNIVNGEPVPTFLSRYPDDVGAIAVNWKCFGSNRFVEKPTSPNVFQNYTMHSEHDFELNYCVKSFFRPKRTETRYINPHRFDVSGRYITPNGQEMVWQEEHPERTVADPDWSVALINHYIIRSAEHFVAKSRRRSDIRRARCGIGLFSTYDRNFHADIMPPARVSAMDPFLYRIQNQSRYDLLRQMSGDERMVSMSADSTSGDIAALKLAFRTCHGTQLVANAVTGEIGHGVIDPDNQNFVPVEVLSLATMPDHVFLTVPSRFLPLSILSDRRISTVLAYQTVPAEDGQISLKNPLTGKILSFIYSPHMETGGAGQVICDRDHVDSWERVEEESSEAVSDPLLTAIAVAIGRFGTITPDEITLDMPRLVDARMAGCATITARDMRKVMVMNDIVSMPWVERDEMLFL
ncbi:glycosyltransferase family 2 protein [Acetobacter conturbans]|uniref:glycosyltransferase family 2 protein n=1 Tax=Acetobacter conturbans TaxID=1737472 RepID=UPI00156985E3|nr:glycosyltransferase family 2 protein [Acetobacter conturbans]